MNKANDSKRHVVVTNFGREYRLEQAYAVPACILAAFTERRPRMGVKSERLARRGH
jgi:hypothetical protein